MKVYKNIAYYSEQNQQRKENKQQILTMEIQQLICGHSPRS